MSFYTWPERPMMSVTLVNRYLALRAAGLMPPIRVMAGRIDIAIGEFALQPWTECRRVCLAQLTDIIDRIESGHKWKVSMLEKTAVKVRISRPDKAPVFPLARGAAPRWAVAMAGSRAGTGRA